MGNRFNARPASAEDPGGKTGAAAHVREIAEADYEREVAGALPIVLEFYGEEKACEVLAPRFAAVAERFAGKVTFLRVLRQRGATLAARLGVTASPTIVFLVGGKEHGGRLVGDHIQRTELKARVEATLGGAPARPA